MIRPARVIVIAILFTLAGVSGRASIAEAKPKSGRASNKTTRGESSNARRSSSEPRNTGPNPARGTARPNSGDSGDRPARATESAPDRTAAQVGGADTSVAETDIGASGATTSDKVGTKPSKTRVYTFGAMDVEGKLKTPQLLYFLNRVKLELEMSAPDRRSFMKELDKSADDPSL